jgi:hypothetical protein
MKFFGKNLAGIVFAFIGQLTPGPVVKILRKQGGKTTETQSSPGTPGKTRGSVLSTKINAA